MVIVLEVLDLVKIDGQTLAGMFDDKQLYKTITRALNIGTQNF